MSHDLKFVDALPDTQAFHDLMLDYYRLMLGKLSAAGGPVLSADAFAAETIEHIGDVLPPRGRTLLAHDSAGRLVGCGVLRRIRADAGELKRMYVRPEARGAGLGRRLFEMRVEEARRAGCTTLYADTIKGNRAMLAMYERFGFSYISRYPENANSEELAPYLVYLECNLSDVTRSCAAKRRKS